MLKEFKDFVARGNVIDLAVAVVIGAAFGAIVASFVKDIVMPPIGLALGHVDSSNLFVSLNGQSFASLAEAQKSGAPTLNYGLFINTILNFIIIAFAVFLVIRQVNKVRPKEPTTKNCPFCTSAISIEATRCPHCTSQLEAASGQR